MGGGDGPGERDVGGLSMRAHTLSLGGGGQGCVGSASSVARLSQLRIHVCPLQTSIFFRRLVRSLLVAKGERGRVGSG